MTETIEVELSNPPLWPWDVSKVAYLARDRSWVQTDESGYYYCLNVMPPIYREGCFAVSEPMWHTRDDRPIYLWLRICGDTHQCRYATVAEIEEEIKNR